jgi:hypothetical protein
MRRYPLVTSPRNTPPVDPRRIDREGASQMLHRAVELADFAVTLTETEMKQRRLAGAEKTPIELAVERTRTKRR